MSLWELHWFHHAVPPSLSWWRTCSPGGRVAPTHHGISLKDASTLGTLLAVALWLVLATRRRLGETNGSPANRPRTPPETRLLITLIHH